MGSNPTATAVSSNGERPGTSSAGPLAVLAPVPRRRGPGEGGRHLAGLPDYPEEELRGGVGVPGSFTVDSPSPDVVEYRYDFVGGPYGTVRPERGGGRSRHRPLPAGECRPALPGRPRGRPVGAQERAGVPRPPARRDRLRPGPRPGRGAGRGGRARAPDAEAARALVAGDRDGRHKPRAGDGHLRLEGGSGHAERLGLHDRALRRVRRRLREPEPGPRGRTPGPPPGPPSGAAVREGAGRAGTVVRPAGLPRRPFRRLDSRHCTTGSWARAPRGEADRGWHRRRS